MLQDVIRIHEQLCGWLWVHELKIGAAAFDMGAVGSRNRFFSGAAKGRSHFRRSLHG